MVDSRAGRVLDPGERSMVDEDEWQWIEEQARGDCDHLLIGTSLPLLLRAGDALPGGLERGAVRRRVGAGRRRASARSSARASTSSTGPRSASRSSA